MGTNFQYCSMDGKLSRAEVKKRFEQMQETDLHQNGSEYSGGWGMARGLEFRAYPVHESARAAEDWLSEHAEKWEAALCVRAKGKSLLHAGKGGADDEHWHIGAWCAS